MSIKNLVTKHFIILLNNGFELDEEVLYNILYNYSFTNGNYIIVLSVDLREHFIDIKVKKATKVLLTVEYGEVMENYAFNGLRDMLDDTKIVYDEAKK